MFILKKLYSNLFILKLLKSILEKDFTNINSSKIVELSHYLALNSMLYNIIKNMWFIARFLS